MTQQINSIFDVSFIATKPDEPVYDLFNFYLHEKSFLRAFVPGSNLNAFESFIESDKGKQQLSTYSKSSTIMGVYLGHKLCKRGTEQDSYVELVREYAADNGYDEVSSDEYHKMLNMLPPYRDGMHGYIYAEGDSTSGTNYVTMADLYFKKDVSLSNNNDWIL